MSLNIEDRRMLDAPWLRPRERQILAAPCIYVLFYPVPPNWILRNVELCIAQQRWVQLPAANPEVAVCCRVDPDIELMVEATIATDGATRVSLMSASITGRILDWGGGENAIRTAYESLESGFGPPTRTS